LALTLKRQRLEIAPLGPTTRSEWVKELCRENKLVVNIGMFRGFTSSAPQSRMVPNHLVFKKYKVTEEPKDKRIKGTRQLFGDIIGAWKSNTLHHDVASRNTATIATHKPDVLHRAHGRGGEQSIVVVGEIKAMPSSVDKSSSFLDFSDEESGQIVDFLQVCLAVQPWRMVVYGYLSDCRRFEFFKATRNKDGVIGFERSGLYIDKVGWDHLGLLLMQPFDALGFEDISVDGWIVDKYLGKGATSAVFSAKRILDGVTAVCKIYLLPGEQGVPLRYREVRALEVLKHDPHVPTVVPDGPVRTVSGRHIVLKIPIGFALQSDVRLSIAHYAPIVFSLRTAHSNDVFHNDIAPENLFAVSNGNGTYRVLLNDFGSATTLEEITDARAGRLKIATRSLFYADSTGAIDFGKAPDLRALVRSVFYLTQNTFNPATIVTAGDLDAVMMGQIPFWRAALQLALAVDYAGLHSHLETTGR